MPVPSRSRLGRGLSALLTHSPAESEPVNNEPSADRSNDAQTAIPGPLRQIPLARIDVNPHQPRRHFDEVALAELADSIRANGLIQPVVVRAVGDRFELIAGERRYRAAGLAGMADVAAIVRDVDRYTQAQWALVENIHRADLNAIERAEAYAALVDQLGLTQAELAGRLGEQRSSVANYLRLMDLPPAVRDSVRAGDLSLGHAKVLAGVAADRVEDLAVRCVAGQWSVRALEEAAVIEPAASMDEAAVSETGRDRPHLRELEQRLVQHLGLRVQVQKGKRAGSGKVVIHYGSLDQFDDLLRQWGLKPNAD